MEISVQVYRPRRAKETPLYRLVSQHIEEFLAVYDERFAPRHGPLRPVVERVLRDFLTCGLPECGYVVTQSVLSQHHADAVAGDPDPTAPPASLDSHRPRRT